MMRRNTSAFLYIGYTLTLIGASAGVIGCAYPEPPPGPNEQIYIVKDPRYGRAVYVGIPEGQKNEGRVYIDCSGKPVFTKHVNKQESADTEYVVLIRENYRGRMFPRLSEEQRFLRKDIIESGPWKKMMQKAKDADWERTKMFVQFWASQARNKIKSGLGL